MGKRRVSLLISLVLGISFCLLFQSRLRGDSRATDYILNERIPVDILIDKSPDSHKYHSVTFCLGGLLVRTSCTPDGVVAGLQGDALFQIGFDGEYIEASSGTIVPEVLENGPDRLRLRIPGAAARVRFAQGLGSQDLLLTLFDSQEPLDILHIQERGKGQLQGEIELRGSRSFGLHPFVLDRESEIISEFPHHSGKGRPANEAWAMSEKGRRAYNTLVALNDMNPLALSSLPISERLALIDIYNSTNGDAWLRKDNWKKPNGEFNDPGTEGTWYGITLDGPGEHVVEIRLRENNLKGPLPGTISSLNRVYYLDILSNKISGPIPDSIGQMTALHTFTAYGNMFSGPIPASMGFLPNLTTLGLEYNQLEGELPNTFVHLPRIEVLSVTGNKMTGEIPSWLGGLTTLIQLRLANKHVGTIPAELGNLRSLKTLWLGDGLTGTIPDALSQLSRMYQLDLTGNHLEGPLPNWLGGFPDLEYLYLSNNSFSGQIPEAIGSLAKLRYLYLTGNQLSGSIPAEIGNLTKLQYCYLDGNQLSGSLPDSIGNLPSLRNFYVRDNQLSGPIPSSLSLCKAMFQLLLNGNRLSGSIPGELGSLPNLSILSLRDNQLSGEIPPELGQLSKLSSLPLDNNLLTGTIPIELTQLASLRGLNLSFNRLTGQIPPELMNLRNLTSLYLDHNHLSGAIPSELSLIPNLLMLSLGYNKLSGQIPPQLGDLAKLVALSLESNSLDGEIPPHMLALLKLGSNRSDFRWNAIHTDTEQVRQFINSKQTGLDWESTQTIAPKMISANAVMLDTIELSWSPIAYTGNTGGYHIYRATSAGGPYQESGQTDNKSDSVFNDTNLTPGTDYFFKIRTETAAHANNQNTVHSEFSEVIEARTPSLDEQMALLIESIEGSAIEEGLKNSLIGKLRGAQDSLAKGNAAAAINKIEAFQNEVRAQSGKKISVTLSAYWLAVSNAILRWI